MTALLARWTEKLAGGPQAGTSDSPPLARAMGVGRQQQELCTNVKFNYLLIVNIVRPDNFFYTVTLTLDLKCVHALILILH